VGGRAATHVGAQASVFGMSGRHGSEVFTSHQAEQELRGFSKPLVLVHTIPAAPALAANTGNGKAPGTRDQVVHRHSSRAGVCHEPLEPDPISEPSRRGPSRFRRGGRSGIAVLAPPRRQGGRDRERLVRKRPHDRMTPALKGLVEDEAKGE
jgi:hypothetical protein